MYEAAAQDAEGAEGGSADADDDDIVDAEIIDEDEVVKGPEHRRGA